MTQFLVCTNIYRKHRSICTIKQVNMGLYRGAELSFIHFDKNTVKTRKGTDILRNFAQPMRA